MKDLSPKLLLIYSEAISNINKRQIINDNLRDLLPNFFTSGAKSQLIDYIFIYIFNFTMMTEVYNLQAYIDSLLGKKKYYTQMLRSKVIERR